MTKFIARQPIFTTGKDVLGYEILFRGGPENYFTSCGVDASTAAVDNLLLFGIDQMTSGRLAFVNCSRDFLLQDLLTLLPSDRVVGEILESVSPDAEVLQACRRLKHAGYRLALDDFVETPGMTPFIELADYIKIDFLATKPPEQQRLACELRHRDVRLVAEKVESDDDVRRGIEMGYHYFQGYFFCRPQMSTRRDIPAYQLNYLRVLQIANEPELDIAKLTDAIRQEASLAYRLLRYLNSPFFALRANVQSIPHALSLLGERSIRRWISLVSVAALGSKKSPELVAVLLTRARFCELLAGVAGLKKSASDLFLMGLLSGMDAILDQPLKTVLADIPVEDEIKEALLGTVGPFRDVFEVAVNYETGKWEPLAGVLKRIGTNEDLIPGLFVQATDWARQAMGVACPA